MDLGLRYEPQDVRKFDPHRLGIRKEYVEVSHSVVAGFEIGEGAVSHVECRQEPLFEGIKGLGDILRMDEIEVGDAFPLEHSDEVFLPRVLGSSPTKPQNREGSKDTPMEIVVIPRHFSLALIPFTTGTESTLNCTVEWKWKAHQEFIGLKFGGREKLPLYTLQHTQRGQKVKCWRCSVLHFSLPCTCLFHLNQVEAVHFV